jgi:hypothetical protein
VCLHLNTVAMYCEIKIDVGVLHVFAIGLWSSSGSEADISQKVASCSD